ncbi:MAG: hypothetical protein CL538_12750 [Alcanivorax sp.]|nr:hypothetical protein [Alcanivorax sp.]
MKYKARGVRLLNSLRLKRPVLPHGTALDQVQVNAIYPVDQRGLLKKRFPGQSVLIPGDSVHTRAVMTKHVLKFFFQNINN